MDPSLVTWLSSPAGTAALGSAEPYDERHVLEVTARLRAEGLSPEQTSAVLTQARLRDRAQDKLGDLAHRLLLTPDGLEQATRPPVAADHAAHLATAAELHPGVPVVDAGCGLGIDTLMLARGLAQPVPRDASDEDPLTHGIPAAARLLALEIDPLTAALATVNLRTAPVPVEVLTASAEDWLPGREAVVWFDPARRTRGVARLDGSAQRTFRLADLAPSWDLVTATGASAPGCGAKLSPGVRHSDLPPDTETVWTSWRGDVVECAVYWRDARLRRPGRYARVLSPAGNGWAEHVIGGEDVPPEAVSGDGAPDWQEWLYEADRAVVRAGVTAALPEATWGTELADGLGWVTSDQLVEVPWARRYRLVEELPAAVKPLRAALRERGLSRISIKRRGIATGILAHDAGLRRELRVSDGDQAILVLTRRGQKSVALLVEPH